MSVFSLSSIKTSVDEVRAKVYPKNETERRVWEALSTKAIPASHKILDEIAVDTNDDEKLSSIMSIIRQTMDGNHKTMVQIKKSLTLLEHLIKNGSKAVIGALREQIQVLRNLEQFHHFEFMVDKGTEIREKAKQLVELLGNNEAIRAERYKARTLKARAVGMGNDNGSAGGFGSGGSSISPNDHALLSSSPSTVVQSVISTFGTSTHLSVSSVASLKTSVDEFRAQVFPHSEVEKKVYEALSFHCWGASSTLMYDIADDTNDDEKLECILSLIWKNIERDGRTWRHITKSLTLLDFLVKNGNNKIVPITREKIWTLSALQEFILIDGTIDRGVLIRNKAIQLVALISSDEQVSTERAASQTLRARCCPPSTSTTSASTSASATASASAATSETRAVKISKEHVGQIEASMSSSLDDNTITAKSSVNFSLAWLLLTTASKHSSPEATIALPELLNSLGVEEPQDLAMCEIDDYRAMANYLKRVHSKQFLEALGAPIQVGSGLGPYGGGSNGSSSGGCGSSIIIGGTVQGKSLPSVALYSEVGDVQYRTPIQLLEGYKPLHSCREHMLQDLAQVLPEVDMSKVVEEGSKHLESCLEHLPGHYPRLSDDTGSAVTSYTVDLKPAASMFDHLNKALQARNPSTLDILLPFLYYFIGGLTSLPVVQGIVYRGLPAAVLDIVTSNYALGTKIHWSGFTSTSTDISVAKRFARGAGGIIICVTTQTGRELGLYSAFRGEREVVLSPNSKFVVSKACSLDTDGYYYVDLIEVIDATFVF